MKGAVRERLESFCRQDGEFAQAVAQGGTFGDCMSHVAQGVKNGHISDLEAYQRAVQFFFPGAQIKCEMTIDLVGIAGDADESHASGEIIVDLMDFL